MKTGHRSALRAWVRGAVLAVAVSVLGAQLASASIVSRYVDFDTQFKIVEPSGATWHMHGCSSAWDNGHGDYWVAGIRGDYNWLFCRSKPSLSDHGLRVRTDSAAIYVDYHTQILVDGVWMHGCARGYAVRGVHLQRNAFACQRVYNLDDSPGSVVADRWTYYWFDGGGASGGYDHTSWSGSYYSRVMRACPDGTILKGLHYDRNILACAPVR
jgi:hypothetical protein